MPPREPRFDADIVSGQGFVKRATSVGGSNESRERLTARERQILIALAKGLTLQQTAEQFGISFNTVATHVRRIYSKLGVRTRAQAALAAQRLGLQWIEQNAAMLGIDASRIAVGGSSAGCGNALWSAVVDAPPGTDPASSPPIRPAAVVLSSGAVDANGDTSSSGTGPLRFGPYAGTISGTKHLDPLMPPFIMWAGDHDETVAQTTVVNLCTTLLQMGRLCEFHNEPGLGHDWRSAPGKTDESRSQQNQFFLNNGLLPALK